MGKSIEQLLEANRHKLEAVALRLTKDEEAAKELFQETAYRVWAHQDRFEPGTDFRAWSCTIMTNYFINQYRLRQRRRRLLQDNSSLNYLYAEGSSRNLGEMHLFRAEVMESLEQIGDDFSTPIRMSSEGYPYQEITEQMGLPLNTLKSRIHYGRKKLKAILK